MRRKLTTREITLLVILVILILCSAYYLFFYVPVRDQIDALKGQVEDTQTETELLRARAERKAAMERELKELFAQDSDPVSMAQYDNVQDVMVELHTILASAEEYSLDFTSVDTEQGDDVVRRNLSLEFRASSYEAAREVLQRLHDSENRCMFRDLRIQTNRSRGSTWVWWDTSQNTGETETAETVQVSATMVFFEYIE